MNLPDKRTLLIIGAILLTALSIFPGIFFLFFDSGSYLLASTLLVILIISLKLKNKKVLLLLFLNPLIFFPCIYSFKAISGYIRQEPRWIECCSFLRTEPVYHKEKRIFMEYMDDDCDWNNFYFFTRDVHNFWTEILINNVGLPSNTYLGEIPDINQFCNPTNNWKEEYANIKPVVLAEVNERFYHDYSNRTFKTISFNDDLVVCSFDSSGIKVVTLFLKTANRSIDFCNCNHK